MALLKLGLKAILVIVLATFCKAGLLLGRAAVDPNDPLSCWNVRQNKSIPLGGTWQEPRCVLATCSLYRNELYVEISTCAQVNPPRGCSISRDVSQEYPHCCPWISCPPEISMDDLLGPEYMEFTDWLDTYYDESYSDYV